MPSEKRSRQRAGRAARVQELQKAQQRRRRKYRVYPVLAVVVVAAIVLILVTSTGGKKHDKVSTASSTTTGSAAASSTTVAGSTTTAAASSPPTAAPVKAGSVSGTAACPKFDGSSPHVIDFGSAPPMCITKGRSYTETLTIDTGSGTGTVKVSFDTTKTPDTANNFIVLSLYHYFDGTALFRTDTSIGIIQGGSPHTQSADDPGPGYTIKDEGSGFTYAAGDLVMARTGAPNSAGSQFFFCVTSDCSNLNSQGTYVVFAHVTSGLDVLQKILASNVQTNSGLGGAPAKLTVVEKTSVSSS